MSVCLSVDVYWRGVNQSEMRCSLSLSLSLVTITITITMKVKDGASRVRLPPVGRSSGLTAPLLITSQQNRLKNMRPWAHGYPRVATSKWGSYPSTGTSYPSRDTVVRAEKHYPSMSWASQDWVKTGDRLRTAQFYAVGHECLTQRCSCTNRDACCRAFYVSSIFENNWWYLV